LAEATSAKKQASEALERGDVEEAGLIMDARAELLGEALAGIDLSVPNAPELRERLGEEQAQARKLARSARECDAMASRKSFMEDINMEERGRADKIRRDRSRGKRDF
jgi:hypothetical protein